MKKELQEILYKKYPLIFENRHLDKTQSCMYWGLCIGDGWFSLLDELCSKLEPIVQEYKDTHPGEDYPRAAQIKEKFAALTFYLDCGTDQMYKLIREYSHRSLTICDRCGGPGKTYKVGYWLHSACNTCLEKEGKKFIEYEWTKTE